MRNLLTRAALTALIAIASAGAASAACNCVPDISGVKQGVHSQYEGGVDAILWPPNHKLATISISAEEDGSEPDGSTSACDVTINSVTQDEPVQGPGSGDTCPDATNINNACGEDGSDACVDLRAERSGIGTGRFYHVNFTMDDPDADCLMNQMDTAVVLVPHDQGVAHIGTWVDEMSAIPSTGPCVP